MTEDSMTRSEKVLERENTVAKALADGAKPLATVADELGMSRNHVYGAFWRLRLRGNVERVRVGTRVPLWQLTAAGAEALGVDQPEPIAETLKRDQTTTTTRTDSESE